MKQVFANFKRLVTRRELSSSVAHRDLVPITVTSPSVPASSRRRQVVHRSGRKDWRVTSFSGF